MITSPRATFVTLAFAAAAGIAFAATASAQEPPRVRAGAGLGISLLVGEDGSDFLDSGVTGWLAAAFRIDRDDRLHLRVEAERAPLAPHRNDFAGTRAENSLYTFAAGPQVGLALGRVRPHLGALAGLAVSRWSTTEPAGRRSGSGSAFGWGGNGGLSVDVQRSAHPVSLIAEARIFNPGALVFGRATTSSSSLPNTSTVDVAVLSVRAGIMIGF